MRMIYYFERGRLFHENSLLFLLSKIRQESEKLFCEMLLNENFKSQHSLLSIIMDPLWLWSILMITMLIAKTTSAQNFKIGPRISIDQWKAGTKSIKCSTCKVFSHAMFTLKKFLLKTKAHKSILPRKIYIVHYNMI